MGQSFYHQALTISLCRLYLPSSITYYSLEFVSGGSGEIHIKCKTLLSRFCRKNSLTDGPHVCFYFVQRRHSLFNKVQFKDVMDPGLNQRQVLFINNGHADHPLNHPNPTGDPTSNNVNHPYHIPAEELSFQVSFQCLEVMPELLHSLLQLFTNV